MRIIGIFFLFLSSSLGYGADDIIFANFEAHNFGEWTAVGGAFGEGPVLGSAEDQHHITGYFGTGFVQSYAQNDQGTGTLTSPEFVINHRYIQFRIGGGEFPITALQLVVDGIVVTSVSGNKSHRLMKSGMNVEAWRGRKARLRIVDNDTGGWGFIMIDHIVFTNHRPGEAVRKEFLEFTKIEELVYAVRGGNPDGHWYANFGYYNHGTDFPSYGRGVPAKLCRVNIRTGVKKVLLSDPTGGIRDPQVHYDAKKILFSYRKGGEQQYHLYEINSDGSNLRQITYGIYDDYEPTYLPDGGIMFVSSRAKRWVNCMRTQVGTIYRCNADGSGIRMVSPNIEHDNTPWILPDGRVAYTRWEYIDRSQVKYHHLWSMNPDGTNQAILYGNMHEWDVYIDAKPIPHTNRGHSLAHTPKASGFPRMLYLREIL